MSDSNSSYPSFRYCKRAVSCEVRCNINLFPIPPCHKQVHAIYNGSRERKRVGNRESLSVYHTLLLESSFPIVAAFHPTVAAKAYWLIMFSSGLTLLFMTWGAVAIHNMESFNSRNETRSPEERVVLKRVIFKQPCVVLTRMVPLSLHSASKKIAVVDCLVS